MGFNEVILVDGSKLYVNGAQTPIFKIKQIREDAFGVFITILPGRELQIRINGTANFISRADANTALIAYLQTFDTGNGLAALLENSDGNNVVDTLGEILEIFQNYPEGADLVTALNGKVDKNNVITAGTKTKITYDSKGLVTSGADLTEIDIPQLSASKITQSTTARFVTDTEKSTWNGKQNALTPGDGISISDNVISATGINLDAYYTKSEINSMIGDIETALDTILGV